MDTGRRRASKPSGTPQLFRASPPKKSGGLSDPLLLSPDVLDDATRRELLHDVLRERRTSPSSADRPSGPGAVTGETHTDKEPFVHQLRARVRTGSNANSDSLVTAMAARLKDLESKQKAYQAELQELHAKYRQLNDKYQRERQLREEAETAVLTLYDEKELLEAQLREMQAAREGASAATRSHPPSPSNRAGKGTHGAQSSPLRSPPTPSRVVKTILLNGDFKNENSDGGAKAAGKEDSAADFVHTARPDALLLRPQKVGGPLDNRNPASTAAASPPLRSRRRLTASDVDVELLKKNAQILSDFVGWKGVVKQGNQGGIRDRDIVRVVIYKNGICVNQGPFRPYGWALCDAFLDDLIEGFYPYEFKEKYPDGFPIEVVDRTSERCETDHSGVAHSSGAAPPANTGPLFPKEGGRRLGAAPQSPNNNPSRVHTLGEKNAGYTPLSAEEFLKKVPAQTVTAGGQLFSVRDGVAALMGIVTTGASSAPAPQAAGTIKHVSAAETAYRRGVVQQERQQRSASPSNAASDAVSSMFVGNLIAVLIRLPNGQKITLHMAPDDTVASLREEFVTAVPSFQAVRYELCQAFPLKREWNEHHRSFASLGVEKSCTLMVKLIR